MQPTQQELLRLLHIRRKEMKQVLQQKPLQHLQLKKKETAAFAAANIAEAAAAAAAQIEEAAAAQAAGAAPAVIWSRRCCSRCRPIPPPSKAEVILYPPKQNPQIKT